MPLIATVRSKHHRRLRNGDAGSSKSLQKALRILLHMGQNGPELGVTRLASALSLNKSTVHRLLTAMEKFELIEKNPESERYRLGLKLHELGTQAIESRTLQVEARQFLLEMSRRSHETVSLAVPGAGGVLCLDRVDSPHTIITVRTRVGTHFPAHCTAAGKAVLAYLPGDAVDAILSKSELTRFTPFTRTRISDVKKDLRLIRRQGYALDKQELERGLSGIAAPVFAPDGQIMAAIGLAGPTLRFRGRELAKKIALTKEIAGQMAAALGERGAWLDPR